MSQAVTSGSIRVIVCDDTLSLHFVYIRTFKSPVSGVTVSMSTSAGIQELIRLVGLAVTSHESFVLFLDGDLGNGETGKQAWEAVKLHLDREGALSLLRGVVFATSQTEYEVFASSLSGMLSCPVQFLMKPLTPEPLRKVLSNILASSAA